MNLDQDRAAEMSCELKQFFDWVATGGKPGSMELAERPAIFRRLMGALVTLDLLTPGDVAREMARGGITPAELSGTVGFIRKKFPNAVGRAR
ncbi:MAG TPA: hypothetical protein VHD62_11170 [Opitutaceae bacterium]|nr:hypothetical protein [Opitutaceae bacterium]